MSTEKPNKELDYVNSILKMLKNNIEIGEKQIVEDCKLYGLNFEIVATLLIDRGMVQPIPEPEESEEDFVKSLYW